MDEMRKRVLGNVVRYAVGREMFCPACKRVLDASRAVLAESELSPRHTLAVDIPEHVVRCVPCWDREWAARATHAREHGYTWTIMDGRALCPEPARALPLRARLGLPAERRRSSCGVVRSRPLANRIAALCPLARVSSGSKNILIYDRESAENPPRRRIRLCQRARAESRYGSGAGWSMSTVESVALKTLEALPDAALYAWVRSSLRASW